MASIQAMRQVLAWEGGAAGHGALVQAGSRPLLRRAVRSGQIQQIARGRYALPELDEARREAVRLCGAVSHSSAALQYGWELVREPRHIHITVPRGRKVRAGSTRIHVHYGKLTAQEVQDHVTAPLRTVVDCARTESFPAALAIADCAVRRAAISVDELRAAGAAVAGPQSLAVRRVTSEADLLAANCFESVVRALALDVADLHVTAQAPIDLPEGRVFVDLADIDLRIVVEADSFAFHGTPTALAADARRYNWLVVNDWIVVRITWDMAMHEPQLVRDWLSALVRLRRTQRATSAATGPKRGPM